MHKKMCSASRASAIFLLLVYVRNGSVLADDDDPSGYTRAGMKICPCFCSVRTGDDQSPYWDEHFGSETLDEKNLESAQCAGSCLEISMYKKYMQNCAEYVDYTFCPRKFTGVNHSDTVEYIKFLDDHAKKCTDGTITMDFEKANPVEHKRSCLNNIQAGACYIVFPRCGTGDVPFGTCSSFCIEERTGCRSLGSTYGHRDYLKSNCENDGRFSNDKLCTGGTLQFFNAVQEVFKLLLLGFIGWWLLY